MRRMTSMKQRICFRLLICSLLLSLAVLSYPTNALEATFTPAPDKDTGTSGGPLPLSQKQREQLLNLHQQIASSPNPAETLQKVAQGNNMAPEELEDLLIRNHRDMQMAAGGAGGGGVGGGVGSTIPRQILRLISTCLLFLVNTAKTRPQTFSIIALAFISIIYAMISAPRNGIVMSTGNSLMSSGHSCWLNPPTSYLSKYTQSDKFDMLPSSVTLPLNPALFKEKSSKKRKKGIGHLSELYTTHKSLKNARQSLMGTQSIPIPKQLKKDVQLIVQCRTKVPFEVLLPSEDQLQYLIEEESEKVETEQEGIVEAGQLSIEEQVEKSEWDNAISLSMDASEVILSSRRFTEYVSSETGAIRFYSPNTSSSSRHKRFHVEETQDDKAEGAALVAKKMGDWGRFGIQPLRVASEEIADDKTSVVYHTLKGGHFDGEIIITREKVEEDDEDPSVIVAVSLIVPRPGRKIRKQLAMKIISSLAESIVLSSVTEAKKIQSRKFQSSAYRGRAKSKAAEKRHLHFDNMKKMEEMAEERRRRWQRSNPSSGGYRPTGRMSRLEGGPSRGF